MPTIRTGISSFDVEVVNEGVFFNNKVFLKRPKGCSLTDWATLWLRLDESYGTNELEEKDGCLVIDLDKIEKTQ